MGKIRGFEKWLNIIVARTAAIPKVGQPYTGARIAEPSRVMRNIFSAARDADEESVPAVANHVTVAAFSVLPITLVWVRSNSISANRRLAMAYRSWFYEYAAEFGSREGLRKSAQSLTFTLCFSTTI